MVDLTKSWVRFRDLPDDMLETMPEHVRETFLAARHKGFEVEMLCAGAKMPSDRRAPRRFVLVADDLEGEDGGGPLGFDLAGLAVDVQAAKRLFVISTAKQPQLYAAAYAAAVEDLGNGFRVALIVETRPAFAEAWAKTLAAMQEGRTVSGFVAAADAEPRRVGPRRRRHVC